jgi:hypothetical protein
MAVLLPEDSIVRFWGFLSRMFIEFNREFVKVVIAI